MHVTHIHVPMRDITAATEWFRSICDLEPVQVIGKSTIYRTANLAFVLDHSESNAQVVIAMASDDCDADYQRMLERGAQSISAPKNYATGSRAALIQGPGELQIEIDQVLLPM